MAPGAPFIDEALPAPLAQTGPQRVEPCGHDEPDRSPSAARLYLRFELPLECIDHLARIVVAVTARKGASREGIDASGRAPESHGYFPPGMTFCATAISSRARSRSDSARATARPKL